MDRYFVLALNPEPWAVGSLGVNRRGAKSFPYIGPNQKLQAYQEAVREALAGKAVLTEGEVEVRLMVWRRIENLKVYSGRDRKAKTSDATNIQKATEDAIQNLLIENDRQVRRISIEVVEQSETTNPCIVINVRPYQEGEVALPSSVWDEIDIVMSRAPDSPEALGEFNPLPVERIEDIF